MSTNGATGSHGHPPSGSPSGFMHKAREVALAFLPTPISHLFEKGLLKPFLMLVGIIFVVPVLTAYLAALWVSQLGKFDNRYAKALHREILTAVNEGFSMEELATEVASRSNKNLDYYQLLSVDLSSRSKPREEIELSVQNWQKVTIDIQKVQLLPKDPNCTLREVDVDVVEVLFEGARIGTLLDGDREQLAVKPAIWTKVIEQQAQPNEPKTLTLRATTPVKEITCGEVQVHISGAILVFKDMWPVPAPPATAEVGEGK